jgi:hypothetical protein
MLSTLSGKRVAVRFLTVLHQGVQVMFHFIMPIHRWRMPFSAGRRNTDLMKCAGITGGGKVKIRMVMPEKHCIKKCRDSGIFL